MTSKKIVLLNILDNELRSFLDEFYKVNNIKKESFLLPHITLRGPFFYKNNISEKIRLKLNDYVNKIKNNKEQLIIDGVDLFKNENQYIVFLKIDNVKSLRHLARKKDYPISKFGFNPHITLFTTKDKNFAYKIINELNNRNINFKCKNVEWSIHELGVKQKNLFNVNIEKDFTSLKTLVSPHLKSPALRYIQKFD